MIRRGIELWTNPGDIVLDPFTGIGSTEYVALKQGRRAIGCELKPSYYKQAVSNCLAALDEGVVEDLADAKAEYADDKKEQNQISMFGMLQTV